MAKLTKEQAIKWDKMLGGGYHFDWRHYVIWGEKHASLKIETSENKVLEATLEYRDERQGYRYTGRQKPVLHLQLWTVDPETGTGTSQGLGASVDVGEIQDKKNWKELCRLSCEYTAEKVLELAKEHAGTLGNPYLVFGKAV